jgi:hypothetical protein
VREIPAVERQYLVKVSLVPAFQVGVSLYFVFLLYVSSLVSASLAAIIIPSVVHAVALGGPHVVPLLHPRVAVVAGPGSPAASRAEPCPPG